VRGWFDRRRAHEREEPDAAVIVGVACEQLLTCRTDAAPGGALRCRPVADEPVVLATGEVVLVSAADGRWTLGQVAGLDGSDVVVRPARPG
jgi:hypothetical protein